MGLDAAGDGFGGFQDGFEWIFRHFFFGSLCVGEYGYGRAGNEKRTKARQKRKITVGGGADEDLAGSALVFRFMNLICVFCNKTSHLLRGYLDFFFPFFPNLY